MGAGKEKNCRLGTVGGQAVMEGVMMKSREGVAIAVRRMDDKRIVVRKKDYKPLKEKCAFFRIPVIRGIVNFVDMMRLSLSTMTASADMLGLEEEGEPSKFEKWLDKHFGKSIMAVASALGVVLGVALALLLFIRSSELRFARWDEIDLRNAMWTIPAEREPIPGVRRPGHE